MDTVALVGSVISWIGSGSKPNPNDWKGWTYGDAKHWVAEDGDDVQNEASNIYSFMSKPDFDITHMFDDSFGYHAVTESQIRNKLSRGGFGTAPATTITTGNGGIDKSLFPTYTGVGGSTLGGSSMFGKGGGNAAPKKSILAGLTSNVVGTVLMIGVFIRLIVYFFKQKSPSRSSTRWCLLFLLAGATTLNAQVSNNGIKQLQSDWNATAGVTAIRNKPTSFPIDTFAMATRARVKKVADSLGAAFVPYVGATRGVDLNTQNLVSSNSGVAMTLRPTYLGYVQGVYETRTGATSISVHDNTASYTRVLSFSSDGINFIAPGQSTGLKFRYNSSLNTQVFVPTPSASSMQLTLADSADVAKRVKKTGDTLTGKLSGTVFTSKVFKSSKDGIAMDTINADIFIYTGTGAATWVLPDPLHFPGRTITIIAPNLPSSLYLQLNSFSEGVYSIWYGDEGVNHVSINQMMGHMVLTFDGTYIYHSTRNAL